MEADFAPAPEITGAVGGHEDGAIGPAHPDFRYISDESTVTPQRFETIAGWVNNLLNRPGVPNGSVVRDPLLFEMTTVRPMPCGARRSTRFDTRQLGGRAPENGTPPKASEGPMPSLGVGPFGFLLIPRREAP